TQLSKKTAMNKEGKLIVESVRKGEGSSGTTPGLTAARPDMSEEFRRRFCLRRFCKSGREKFSAVIIRAANEDFFPGIGVTCGEMVAIGDDVNVFWRLFH